ncbi:PilZ domain-containing protein [Stakelama pacifica]|uniref:PilZ domain-containing protein n=1 Tax=Stakelama pacifica TaxID=517720 RepID=A0A4R6FKN1_9SPHN|nr:PilZ domain-containing protein [Stakelama pacifica]MAX01194.1 hypothetical protein [Sphingomonas sp.]TDN81135.1 PilZ domain-containing protein [Stakelama pacifica]GGO96855.1 hypothetical protein GCM10011329_24340 [Stakelama pacifica]
MSVEPFSPQPSEAASFSVDRRAPETKRLVTTLLVGRLLFAGTDGLCRVRNISTGGARIETPATLAPGDPVQVELRGDIVLAGHVRWTGPGVVGMEFVQPIDTDAVLHGAQSDTDWHQRMPRITTQCPVTVRQHGRIVHADMLDINPRGARLANLQWPLAEGLFTLNIPQLEPVEGTIRWCDNDMAGIQFTKPILYSALAEWLQSSPTRFALR